MRAALIERRKRHVLAGLSLAGLRCDRLEARQPINHVMLEARLRLLTFADNVDAERALLLHDLLDRLAGFARERRGVERLSVHARKQQS